MSTPAPARTWQGPSAPERLALLLWGRTTPADAALAVTGDLAALDAALAGRITP